MSEHKRIQFGTAISGLVGTVLLIAAVYVLTAAQFSTGRDVADPQQSAARVAPVGSVDLAGAGVAGRAPAALPVPAQEGPGVVIYNKACTACHADGAAGAPKLGDKAAWEAGMNQGVEQLLRTAINGKGAMPPRGTCMDCTDADLMAAIEYMLVEVGYEPMVSVVTDDATPADGMFGRAGVVSSNLAETPASR